MLINLFLDIIKDHKRCGFIPYYEVSEFQLTDFTS